MSVAERLRQEGRQAREQIGLVKGKIEAEKQKAISIAKAMLLKGYPVEDIMLLTGFYSSNIRYLVQLCCIAK